MFKKKFSIGNLPFIYSPLHTPNNPEGIPNCLPFSVESRNGVISQAQSRTVEEALEKAYLMGSMISGQMDDFGNGKEYADEFLNWVYSNTTNFQGKYALDIGCGTGYLLSELKRRGANCIGVEPGDSAVYGQEKYGIKIRREFFDVHNFEEKFDYIFFYGVLEHIYEIEDFLKNVRTLLNAGGVIYLAVPNCEKQIVNGDISMFFSEHWSYFTQMSLENVLKRNGLYGEVSISKLEGVLFARVQPEDEQVIVDDEEASNRIYNAFLEKYIIQKQKFIDFLEGLNGNTIGIYVPGRLVNWLSVVGDIVTSNNLRFIDDNVLLKGTYFPGFNNPIESLEEFIINPSEQILIASYTYDNIIEARLEKCGYVGEVTKLQQIFS